MKVGRVGVMGDSSCFDDIVSTAHCLWLIDDLFAYLIDGEISPAFLTSFQKLSDPFFASSSPPTRPSSFSRLFFSFLLFDQLNCYY